MVVARFLGRVGKIISKGELREEGSWGVKQEEWHTILWHSLLCLALFLGFGLLACMVVKRRLGVWTKLTKQTIWGSVEMMWTWQRY